MVVTEGGTGGTAVVLCGKIEEKKERVTTMPSPARCQNN